MIYSADWFAGLPKNELDSFLNTLPESRLKKLKSDWVFWARDNQLPPEEWGIDGCFIWSIRAGRGFGKTRAGAETFISAVRDGGYKYPNLAGATAEDVRDLMIEGESGILACAPDDFYPDYIPSAKKLIFPNGVTAHIYYGSEPDKARGPQSDFLWCDELAKWQRPEETFDNLLMGLRLGENPLCIITSTPRPTKFLMELENRKDENGRKCTVVTRGNTVDNFSNLSPVFISTIISKYKGTRLGRQELEGQFLDDNPDALWKRADIDNYRVRAIPDLLDYVVVGVDPAATSKEGSDDTGIVVAAKGRDGHGYILGDYTIHDTPQQWGRAVITAYNKHEANVIVGEVNQGGEMVEHTLKMIDRSVPFKAVHASRGKAIRAEPVSALYEQGKVHHYGFFRELEDEMCEWIPGSGDSPDRCFIAGTKITTDQGEIPIENIKVGMKVLTRKGYKRVTASGITSNNSDTITVLLSNGKSLTGTHKHPIYIKEKGFRNMDALVLDDEVLTCKETLSCMTELNLQDIHNQQASLEVDTTIHLLKKKMEKNLKDYIKKFGKGLMVKFQGASTSTIKMGILATILLITSNVYQKKSIRPDILKGNVVQNKENILIECDHSRKSGIHQKKDINGTLNTESHHGKTKKKLKEYVNNAKKNILLNAPVKTFDSVHENVLINTTDKIKHIMKLVNVYYVVANSKLINQKHSSIAHVNVLQVLEGGLNPVYNISVDGCNEYFANGILVHNCDALVWAVTELNLITEVSFDDNLGKGSSLASSMGSDTWDMMFPD
jgi:phage terminase large subunit-like protein